MEESLLKVKSPVAKKDYVCEVCGGVIHKGERYELKTILKDKKVKDFRRHLKCHKEMKVKNDHDFRKEVSLDVKQMLDSFSFEECMQIAFFPLVITELAWIFTDKVIEMSVAEKIQETKKLSRAVKELRKSYVEYCRKDLDWKHFKHVEDESKQFVGECNKDFTLLYFSVNNEIKKQNPNILHIEMRTYAYMALSMIDALREHNIKMDKLISERAGKDSRIISSVLPKHTMALIDCLKAYMLPIQYARIDHVRNSISIILNKISKCEYVIH